MYGRLGSDLNEATQFHTAHKKIDTEIIVSVFCEEFGHLLESNDVTECGQWHSSL